MRMARIVSVTRQPLWCGSASRDEQNPSGSSLAYASAAVSRPGKRPLRLALDASARPEGLLGYGENPGGISEFSCHVQRGAGSRLATGGICQRHFQRTVV